MDSYLNLGPLWDNVFKFKLRDKKTKPATFGIAFILFKSVSKI